MSRLKPPTQQKVKTESYPEHVLTQSINAMRDRATSRDKPDGERSMRRAVDAFNGLVGGDRRLTEHEGWLFMAVLKMARATAGNFNPDDYVDGAAYFALASECAANTPLQGA